MENNSFSETFSKNLAELLKNNNINQKELAKKISSLVLYSFHVGNWE